MNEFEKYFFEFFQYTCTLNFKSYQLLLWEIRTRYLCQIQIVGRYKVWLNLYAGQINYVSHDLILFFLIQIEISWWTKTQRVSVEKLESISSLNTEIRYSM